MDRNFAWIVCVLIVGISCSGPSSSGDVAGQKPAIRPTSTTKTSTPWYDPATTRYNFGLILAGADSTRTHQFRINNISAHPVRIKGVANRKPCCGDVAPITLRVIEPGQFIEVTVTLHIGLGAGQLLHVATIETDGEGEDSGVQIYTSATAHARVTVEDTGPNAGPLEPGQPRRVEFLVRSFGVASDPPRPLDDRAIRCGLRADWVGPPTKLVDAEAGLDEIRRTLAVTLPSSIEPVNRTESLEVLDGRGAIVGRRWINWEVASALKASPSGLIFGNEAQAARGLKVVVRALDGHPFRITSTSTEIDGLKIGVDSDSRPMHTLTARLASSSLSSASRSGEIVVRTDHPDQPVLKVAVYLTVRANDGIPQDAPEKPK